MSFKNYLGLFGCLFIIAGGMSPMLWIPVIGNWNYWDIDTVLASIVFFLAGTGLLGAIMKKPGLAKFSGGGVLIVVLFTLVAVYFKVNDYFSFIPFKKLARIASNMVHYKWPGWALIVCGSLLMIFSARRSGRKTT